MLKRAFLASVVAVALTGLLGCQPEEKPAETGTETTGTATDSATTTETATEGAATDSASTTETATEGETTETATQ